MKEKALRRAYALRDLSNDIRYVVKTGCQWRYLPHESPWAAVSQLGRRWSQAGVFEAVTHDLRAIVRFLNGRDPEPTAAIFDGRTLQSTPECGGRAGFDGAKKGKGSKVYVAVDTSGNPLALKVTAADEQERAQLADLARRVQDATGGKVEVAFVDQGYTGAEPAGAAEAEEIKLEMVKHTEAKRGFALLPRRWVVERSFGWVGRSRRLARDYERLSVTLAGWVGLHSCRCHWRKPG